MFLAAAPYFYHRFSSDEWAAAHYQSSILIVSTVTNLGSSFTLAKLQKRTSYPKQITVSLLINIVIFSLLALSTGLLKNASIGLYFSFLMLMVAGTSLATGMNQIGVFAYVSGFGRPEYTQAIMAGQGLAGVLPCIVQILSVLVVPEQTGEQKVPQESAKSAFLYFITSTFVSLSALVAFGSLSKRRSNAMSEFAQSSPDTASDHTGRKTVSLWGLFKKLRFMALALFLCFAVTMMFPVFTAKIESVRDPQDHRINDLPSSGARITASLFCAANYHISPKYTSQHPSPKYRSIKPTQKHKPTSTNPTTPHSPSNHNQTTSDTSPDPHDSNQTPSPSDNTHTQLYNAPAESSSPYPSPSHNIHNSSHNTLPSPHNHPSGTPADTTPDYSAK
ncbi:unnamed protein product [Aspergillus oryzae var. brunneus]|uniref:Unnamed protein product n=2 Tax=Aspergillus oryzae TaxID=5062 RepID=A0AAN4YVR0_ASPOZ|nr:unnamed protein product [Aspergillus oryzae]GMG35239.1 unnamed protein product [Aspergillus oryzae]GMG53509.1 unnamed protein product [Aspergillus oryzae var. brunneus]